MRPKGLTQAEVEKIVNFDWDDSEDEENEEEEQERTANFENIIEETLKNVVDNGENVEADLIEELIGRENYETEMENEEVVQVMEKIDLQSLRWRSAEVMDCNTSWKSEVCSSEVKQPIEYFNQIFTDEVWQNICDETNLYASQTNGTELKCTLSEIKRYVGILLYLAVVKIPTYRMAWEKNFKLTAVANAMPRNRFEKIKQFFHINNNSVQPQKGQPGYDKLYKVRPLLNSIKRKFNEISQEEFQSIDEQMIAYKGRDVYTTTKCSNLAATDVLPIPNNIDVAETTRFSPHRSREISSTVLLSQNYQGISAPKIDITTDNSFNNDVLDKQDPHVQSYDCFGAISLNSAMQSNVPSPFGGMHKFTHLNMPGGQWSQDCKFMSQNLQSSHYTTLRKNARSNWSTYDKDATIQNKDSTIAWNIQTNRSYCYKADKPEENTKVQSKKDQLKKAFKDYGSIIVIFHVAISLVSLGGFFLLVSSGIDLISILEHLDFAPTALKNSVALGASNFVIAYTIHKVFAPVRISITLGAAPFIVRYLRSKGLLKPKN